MSESQEYSDIRVAIFDFDGVIVESNGIKEDVFRSLFAEYPEAYDDLMAYHHKYVSLTRYKKFDYMLERIGRAGDEKMKAELLKAFSARTLDRMKSVAYVKGAKELLSKLSSKMPVYLVSVTPIEDLDIIIDELGLRDFFRNIYGCPPWNKPDAIRDICSKENIAPREAVLIGDSYGDQSAAQETGIRFIGRDSGLGFRGVPELVVADLDELAQYF